MINLGEFGTGPQTLCGLETRCLFPVPLPRWEWGVGHEGVGAPPAGGQHGILPGGAQSDTDRQSAASRATGSIRESGARWGRPRRASWNPGSAAGCRHPDTGQIRARPHYRSPQYGVPKTLQRQQGRRRAPGRRSLEWPLWPGFPQPWLISSCSAVDTSLHLLQRTARRLQGRQRDRVLKVQTC